MINNTDVRDDKKFENHLNRIGTYGGRKTLFRAYIYEKCPFKNNAYNCTVNKCIGQCGINIADILKKIIVIESVDNETMKIFKYSLYDLLFEKIDTTYLMNMPTTLLSSMTWSSWFRTLHVYLIVLETSPTL